MLSSSPSPSARNACVRALLSFLALCAGCAQAPPVSQVRDAKPTAPAQEACEVSKSPECRPFGDCSAQEVIGRVCVRKVQPGESLIEMARRYDLGFNQMQAANPALDPFVPTAGSSVVIPTAWIVPRACEPGTLVVNLSEMRLYLSPRAPRAPTTFPVGIGSEGWKTPLGVFTVVEKQENPRWYPPASIRREDPDLPAVVEPGPDNPLGTHALRLSKRTILIHGTDTPFAIGRKASHGCLRLYPEDIPYLYERVPVGSRVTIIREPVKVGLREGKVYLEVHEDPDSRVDYLAQAKRLLAVRGVLNQVDPRKVEAVAKERKGYPVDISTGGD